MTFCELKCDTGNVFAGKMRILSFDSAQEGIKEKRAVDTALYH